MVQAVVQPRVAVLATPPQVRLAVQREVQVEAVEPEDQRLTGQAQQVGRRPAAINLLKRVPVLQRSKPVSIKRLGLIVRVRLLSISLRWALWNWALWSWGLLILSRCAARLSCTLRQP